MDDDLHELSRTVILRFGDAVHDLGEVKFTSKNESAMFIGSLRKLWKHGLSALKLCEEPITEREPDLRDYASIAVIARAALESAGVFKHLFYSGLEEDKKRFTLAYMEMRSLTIQTLLDPIGEAEKAKQAESQARIDTLKAEFPKYDSFRRLKGDDRRSALKGRWEPFTKSSLPRILGFGPKAQHYYKFLSDYTHNGYLASLQVSQPEEARKLARSGLIPIALTQSLMLKTLSEHAPEVKAFIKADSELEKATGLYISFGDL